jgi:hypothetical protein
VHLESRAIGQLGLLADAAGGDQRAGDLLDRLPVPDRPRLGLVAGDEADVAAQADQVAAMLGPAALIALQEGADAGVAVIIAVQLGQRLVRRRLAVIALALVDVKRLVGRQPGQRVAVQQLERLELLDIGRQQRQALDARTGIRPWADIRRRPAASACRRGRGEAGDVPLLADALETQRAVQDVVKQRIAVEILRQHGEDASPGAACRRSCRRCRT